jgi:MYXO-CTERM domain-containing protein
MQNVFTMGGATRTARPCGTLIDYTCRRVEYQGQAVTLPPVSEPDHGRFDFMPAYGPGVWLNWSLNEKYYHTAFNDAGACVRNLNGDAFFIYGDARLRFMRDGSDRESHSMFCGIETSASIRVIADGVRASVQSLFDAYDLLAAGEATFDDLTAAGSAYFAALAYLPVYVISNPNPASYAGTPYGSNHFTGRWVRHAAPLQSIAGVQIPGASLQDCAIEYINGGSGLPPANRPRCQAFPLIIRPSSISVAPEEQVAFTAKGGSDVDDYPEPPAYVWSLETNASGGSIDPATGAYTAGAKTSVTDVVAVTDSAGAKATANVQVTSPTGASAGSGCSCSVPGEPAPGGPLLLLVAAVQWLRRRRATSCQGTRHERPVRVR